MFTWKKLLGRSVRFEYLFTNWYRYLLLSAGFIGLFYVLTLNLNTFPGAYAQWMVYCPSSSFMRLGSDATYGHAGMPLYLSTMSWVGRSWSVPSQQQPPKHLPPASGKRLIAKGRPVEKMWTQALCTFLWVSMLLKAQGHSPYKLNPLDSTELPSGPSLVTHEAFYGEHGARKCIELGKPKGALRLRGQVPC